MTDRAILKEKAEMRKLEAEKVARRNGVAAREAAKRAQLQAEIEAHQFACPVIVGDRLQALRAEIKSRIKGRRAALMSTRNSVALEL